MKLPLIPLDDSGEKNTISQQMQFFKLKESFYTLSCTHGLDDICDINQANKYLVLDLSISRNLFRSQGLTTICLEIISFNLNRQSHDYSCDSVTLMKIQKDLSYHVTIYRSPYLFETLNFSSLV
jgi:hypothetical protein